MGLKLQLHMSTVNKKMLSQHKNSKMKSPLTCQFDDFHPLPINILTYETQVALLELVDQGRVHLEKQEVKCLWAAEQYRHISLLKGYINPGQLGQFPMEIRPEMAYAQQIIFHSWQPTQHQIPPVLP